MTTTPAAQAAPLPVEPGQSLDLTPKTPTAVQGAAGETAGAAWGDGKLLVGPAEYPHNAVAYDLVPELTGYDMIVLQEAQDSGKFRAVIEAIQQLVIDEQRPALLAQLLDPSPAIDRRISLEQSMLILSTGMEQISARPRNK